MVENGIVNGDITVTDDFTLQGMVTGDATVEPGGVLFLHGMVEGDLIVARGGHCELRGVVEGDAINHGGKILVYGVINGESIDPTSGTQLISGVIGTNVRIG